MNRVFVLNGDRTPLSPTHPANARKLLKRGKAAVLRVRPFMIILKRTVENPAPQPLEVKFDPGSKTTGIAIVQHNQTGKRVVFAAELQHRGEVIKERLTQRRQYRRGRRTRNLRYRKPRFQNRTRPKGWLAPSIKSRVYNIETWFIRLCKWANVTGVSVENVKFDTQLMENPDISGLEYQRGTLYGYELKEYLLHKYSHTCAYCRKTDRPLEIEHIIPKSRGGSNRLHNLTIACRPCNRRKGDKTAAEFGHPDVGQKGRSMKDIAAVNIIRKAIVNVLDSYGIPVSTGTGGQTKYNRTQQNYPKSHWIDAACVGDSGQEVQLDPDTGPLTIKAVGRQNRRMISPNAVGFPYNTTKTGCHLRRKKSKDTRRVIEGLQSNDLVKVIDCTGKYRGTHIVYITKTSGRWGTGKTSYKSDRVHLLSYMDGYKCQ